ncbi:MAG: AmmeMemoRadiSam system protein B [Candidatus Kerfeldbacteria bacterium]|nr:AmmeMemoRadiSam system protein B [Candidatus Kerfeldbacteria bacterium]
MPIVAAAVVPHSPLLIPAIAKDHAPLADQTRQAIKDIGAEIYASAPDVVVVCTPHGPAIRGSFVIHTATHFHGTLKDFGDFQTAVDVECSTATAQEIKQRAEHDRVPVRLQTDEQLDYGTSVPMVFWQPHFSHIPLLPITTTDHPPEELSRIARVIHDVATASSKRFALVASADLLRRTDPGSAESRRPQPLERKISQAITAVDPSGIPEDQPIDVCGLEPITLLLHVLHGLADHGSITSFEAPFGVGLLTATFSLRR